MTTRPAIPAPIKRAIRQRCGFGCVICGCPAFDYEHIDGYQLTGHDASRMTLLCPTHHREKTAGRMPVGTVRKHDAKPYNAGKRYTKGHPLFFDPEQPLALHLGNLGFTLGDNGFRKVGVAVDGDYALAVGVDPDGHPIVDIDVRDPDDRLLLRVAHGQMRVATSVWDVDFVGTRLHLRHNQRHTVIDVHLDAPSSVIDVQSADFSLHRVPMLIGRQSYSGGFELPATGSSLSSFSIRGGGVAVGVTPPDSTMMRFGRRPSTSFG